ncbi:MAG: branched-chain amino acid ABC transporter substrate-binding protein, partial [Mesorhizobium sp.]
MINRRSTLKSMALGAVSTLAIAAVGISYAQAENKELKIGFVGVTSGPAAAWGTSNVRSMQTRAAWLNETGGVKIGNDTYNINIVTFDDQK